MQVVINVKHGGFGLSEAAMRRYFELKGWECYPSKVSASFIEYWKVPPEKQDTKFYSELTFFAGEISRSDPDLITVVQELGEKANDRFSKLKIVEIPDDVQWEIQEYDGWEHIAEKHRTWS